MDPLRQITDLTARRDEFERALAAAGTNAAERVAILHCIAETTAQITALYRTLPAPAPRGRSAWTRARSFVFDEIVFIGPPAAYFLGSVAYVCMFRFTPVRHRHVPYTANQLARREDVFPGVFKRGSLPPAGAIKTVYGSALLLAFAVWQRISTAPTLE